MVDSPHPNAIKMGTLTKIAGVSDQTVRHYERLGLIKAIGRTKGGFRLFDPSVVDRFQFIRSAQAMGFTLEAIRVLLKGKHSGDESCEAARRVMADHLQDVEQRIEMLNRQRELLQTFSGVCLGCINPCLLEAEMKLLPAPASLSTVKPS
jgi:DNA-binding transcriptional MerR regulator